jgi:hypothetical protein
MILLANSIFVLGMLLFYAHCKRLFAFANNILMWFYRYICPHFLKHVSREDTVFIIGQDLISRARPLLRTPLHKSLEVD